MCISVNASILCTSCALHTREATTITYQYISQHTVLYTCIHTAYYVLFVSVHVLYIRFGRLAGEVAAAEKENTVRQKEVSFLCISH